MNIDKLINTFDTGLRTVFATSVAARPRPDAHINEPLIEASIEAASPKSANLSNASKAHAAALMRVNHVGEVCAQALYSGQALSAKNPQIVDALKKAAAEEIDHLAWCDARISELGGRKSMLNPLWYAGSFTLGAVAGLFHEKWNLGFLAETEKQVSAHLQNHLQILDVADIKTRTIVEQMQLDEVAHAAEAKQLGASELPMPIVKGMQLVSSIMTKTAYYI